MSRTPPPPPHPTGQWIGASYALGRTVDVAEPYPHICGSIVVGRATGREVKLWRRDCAACSQEADAKRREREVTDEMLAEQRRRIGERDE